MLCTSIRLTCINAAIDWIIHDSVHDLLTVTVFLQYLYCYALHCGQHSIADKQVVFLAKCSVLCSLD